MDRMMFVYAVLTIVKMDPVYVCAAGGICKVE